MAFKNEDDVRRLPDDEETVKDQEQQAQDTERERTDIDELQEEPTPLISEEVASAIGCSDPDVDNEGHTEILTSGVMETKSILHFQPPSLIDRTAPNRELSNIDIGSIRKGGTSALPASSDGDSGVVLLDGGERCTIHDSSDADDEMIADSDPNDYDDHLPYSHHIYPAQLCSLEELLISVDHPLTPRSLSNLTNAPLSFSQVDSLLIDYGFALPPHQFALHYAVLQRDLPMTYLLMRSRFRYMVNERDSLGRTPFHIALLSADYEILQILLSMPVIDPSHSASSNHALEEEEDVEFPDLSLKFSHLPSLHLPLAKAGWADQIPNVLATYTLLLAYLEVVEKVGGGYDPACPGLDVLARNCGWTLSDTSSSSEGPLPVRGLHWALQCVGNFLETKEHTDDHLWTVNARDGWDATTLHHASELGAAQVVVQLLDAGADISLKDSTGDLPVHRSIDSSDPNTFTALLRRGSKKSFVRNGSAGGISDDQSLSIEGEGQGAAAASGVCGSWSGDISIMTLFKRCILRGSWRCLGRLVTDEVYSQFPIPEIAMDGLLEFANLCGYSEEFSEAFKMAVDNTDPQEDGHVFNWKKLKGGAASNLSTSSTTSYFDLRIFAHDSCFDHLPLPVDSEKAAGLKKYKLLSRFPENPSRLFCLTPLRSGILRTRTFERIAWEEDFAAASFADILRVHDWSYIRSLVHRVEKVTAAAQLYKNTKPSLFHEIDGDTPITSGSWHSAKMAAGVVIAAVRSVCRGEIRQAFCAVRPPGHHVGTWGASQPPTVDGVRQRERQEDWAHGSQGFCLLNNVAIGAAYARYNFAAVGIRKIAIVDFDVHHGNGTEQILLNVRPRERKIHHDIRHGIDMAMKLETTTEFWKLWLDETDTDNLFFASIHGFGNNFYPGTGGTVQRESHPYIHNVTLINGATPEMFKAEFQSKIIEPLAAFRPDLIMLSAGFDAHCHDSVNEGFGACSEHDYFWITRHLIAVANECCDGRIVSVLEGGYNTKAATLSPLAQSVGYHIKAFMQTPPGLSIEAAKLLDDAITPQHRGDYPSEVSPDTSVDDSIAREPLDLLMPVSSSEQGARKRQIGQSTLTGDGLRRKRRRAAIKCLEVIHSKREEHRAEEPYQQLDSSTSL